MQWSLGEVEEEIYNIIMKLINLCDKLLKNREMRRENGSCYIFEFFSMILGELVYYFICYFLCRWELICFFIYMIIVL